jgi:DNA-binding transcriptional regulator YdaS (Cro superfamily)
LINVFSCAKLLLNMNLLKYLEVKSISQSDFAKSIEVSPGMLNQWLSGHRPIAPAKCIAIERATDGLVTRQDLRADWEDIWPIDMPSKDNRHLSDRRESRRKKVIK